MVHISVGGGGERISHSCGTQVGGGGERIRHRPLPAQLWRWWEPWRSRTGRPLPARLGAASRRSSAWTGRRWCTWRRCLHTHRKSHSSLNGSVSHPHNTPAANVEPSAGSALVATFLSGGGGGGGGGGRGGIFSNTDWSTQAKTWEGHTSEAEILPSNLHLLPHKLSTCLWKASHVLFYICLQ